MNTPSNQIVPAAQLAAQPLPAHLQNRQARVFETSADFLPYIKLRNGQFIPVMGGEEQAPIPGPLTCVILDAQPKAGRTYYHGAYDPTKKATTPDCWSSDGKVPSDSSRMKQSAACMNCPKNAKNSGADGRSKACSYNRRMVIMVPGYESPFSLKLGGMSLFADDKHDPNIFPYNKYEKMLMTGFSAPVDPSWVWTVIRFNPAASVPALQFYMGADRNGNSYLDENLLAAVDAVREANAEEIAQVVSGTFDAGPNNHAPAVEDQTQGAQFAQQPLPNNSPTTVQSAAQTQNFAGQPDMSPNQAMAAQQAQAVNPAALGTAQPAAGVTHAGPAGETVDDPAAALAAMAQTQQAQQPAQVQQAQPVAAEPSMAQTQQSVAPAPEMAQVEQAQPAQQPAQQAPATNPADVNAVLGQLAQATQNHGG